MIISQVSYRTNGPLVPVLGGVGGTVVTNDWCIVPSPIS